MGFREGQSQYSNTNLEPKNNIYGKCNKGKEFSESWVTVCLYTFLKKGTDWNLRPEYHRA